MSHYLSLDTEFLQTNNAFWTAKEITQQPECWEEVAKNIAQNSELKAWIEAVLAKQNLRIILTGAGTSAYIGDALAPHITKARGHLVESISTTSIVSSPTEYLLADVPTLLVSYGRSGDSPESVAAIDLADTLVEDCFHLVMTCNSDGSLAKYASRSDNAFAVLMPAQTLDQSFAMTSSFSSMYIATLCVFAADNNQLKLASETAEHVIQKMCSEIKDISELDNTKQIFLGSGSLTGIAKEASLKYLELTAGKIGCFCESSLGFRHGPKSNVDEGSLIIIFDANDNYIRSYDLDMADELSTDNIAMGVISLGSSLPDSAKHIMGAWQGLPYIVFCQILSFYKSLSLGLTPDNPCPTGEVNRVVKGVNIYPFS